MKKILLGVLGLMVAGSLTFATARALFSSKATASNVTFATGNADLKIWRASTSEWVSDWNPDGLNFSGMYPLYGGTGADESTSTKYQKFYLKNLSLSPISLSVVGKLRSGVTENPAGSWNTLKDKVYVAVLMPDWSDGTGWHTLNEWYTAGYTLPGSSIAQNTQQEYRFYVRVDGSTGNEIAGKSISAVNFDFTGTQVTP